MGEVRGWLAWYEDGSVYSSEDTRWEGLPREGALGFVEYLDPPYRKTIDGGDWFWIEDGRIQTTENSLWDDWVDLPDGVEDPIRAGSLPDEEWEQVRQEMLEAREWAA